MKTQVEEQYKMEGGASAKPGQSGQRTIEPQKLQKGAMLYSSAQNPTKSVQLCAGKAPTILFIYHLKWL
jgi:hypothetical protein